jgi:Spy/CpxP family protein refolding chaperone
MQAILHRSLGAVQDRGAKFFFSPYLIRIPSPEWAAWKAAVASCRTFRKTDRHTTVKETIMKGPFFTYPAILSLSAVLFAASAMAEPPRGSGPGGEWRNGPPGAEQQLSRLDQALDLSDAQSAELLAVLQAADAERQALHQRVMAEFRPEICALMQDTDADILAVLTPEQAATYQQMKEERRQRHGGGQDGGWGHRFGELDCAEAN